MKFPITRLGTVADFIRGVSFKPDDVQPLGTENTIACFRTKNVQAEIDLNDVWAVPCSAVNRGEQILQEGDLLISSANSWNLVGKCCWVPRLDWPATLGGFISALRPKRAEVFPRFLYHWFSFAPVQAKLRGCARQTTNISNLDLNQALDLRIPLPPMREQRRIAAILDKADDLRQKRRLALQKLDSLTRSIFLDMFANKHHGDYDVRTVEEIADQTKNSIRTGPFGSQLLHGEFIESGIPVLGIDNIVTNEFAWAKPRFISEKKYRELERYTIHPGDVLITIMGTCGRCAIAPNDIPIAINTKHICCITLDLRQCLPEFLHAYFLLHPEASHYLNQTSKGAIMDGLNMGIIKQMPVFLPPIESQKKYSKIVANLNAERGALRTSLNCFDAQFASLQHRAFRGEL